MENLVCPQKLLQAFWHKGKESLTYQSLVMSSFTTRCRQILSLTGRDFGPFQMSRTVAISLVVAKKNKTKKKGGLVTSARGSEIKNASLLLLRPRKKCSVVHWSLVWDINKALALRQQARRQANMWETNQDVNRVESERLKHRNEKGSRRAEGLSNSQKPWKPDRQHKTQLWSPQRGHWLAASGLPAGPCWMGAGLMLLVLSNL